MNSFMTSNGLPGLLGALGAAATALALTPAPAHAGGDITNFKVENCTSERIFVCSFDKTDGSLKIPYKAAGVQPKGKKEFGCASLDKCKVIIGASNKRSKTTPSTGENAALGGAGAGLTVAGASVAGVFTAAALSGAGITAVLVGFATGGAAVAVLGLAAGGAVAGIEIKDGWKDGEVCNQVRRAAQKAGMKPKSFMKNGKNYQVIEQYATDENGNQLVYGDGTAVVAYAIQKGKGKCPATLD